MVSFQQQKHKPFKLRKIDYSKQREWKFCFARHSQRLGKTQKPLHHSVLKKWTLLQVEQFFELLNKYRHEDSFENWLEKSISFLKAFQLGHDIQIERGFNEEHASDNAVWVQKSWCKFWLKSSSGMKSVVLMLAKVI